MRVLTNRLSIYRNILFSQRTSYILRELNFITYRNILNYSEPHARKKGNTYTLVYLSIKNPIIKFETMSANPSSRLYFLRLFASWLHQSMTGLNWSRFCAISAISSIKYSRRSVIMQSNSMAAPMQAINILRFLPFQKSLNFYSLIANQVKANMILNLNETLFIVLTTFVPLFTVNWYNNNYNNNCLSDITIRCSAYNYNCFVRTSLTTCYNTD